ncbi:hypothetical protein EON68_03015 [archaeon]|nr:MAG: hypothetical protein EON68_03015 [archaeon]
MLLCNGADSSALPFAGVLLSAPLQRSTTPGSVGYDMGTEFADSARDGTPAAAGDAYSGAWVPPTLALEGAEYADVWLARSPGSACGGRPRSSSSSSSGGGAALPSSSAGGPTPFVSPRLGRRGRGSSAAGTPTNLTMRDVFMSKDLELPGLFQELGLYSVFRQQVACLWHLWELAITGTCAPRAPCTACTPPRLTLHRARARAHACALSVCRPAPARHGACAGPVR